MLNANHEQYCLISALFTTDDITKLCLCFISASQSLLPYPALSCHCQRVWFMLSVHSIFGLIWMQHWDGASSHHLCFCSSCTTFLWMSAPQNHPVGFCACSAKSSQIARHGGDRQTGERSPGPYTFQTVVNKRVIAVGCSVVLRNSSPFSSIFLKCFSSIACIDKIQSKNCSFKGTTFSVDDSALVNQLVGRKNWG